MFLRNPGLYQPITMTEEMAVDKFQKYIDIRKNQAGRTSLGLVRRIKDDFYGAHSSYVSKEVLDSVWNRIEKWVEENEALAQFTLDFEGALSDYFFPWLVAVATSPSAALEMSYGSGWNLDGKWRECGAGDDEIDYFVRNDPTFVYNRERQLFVADLATSVRNVLPNGAKCKVIDLGAGRMAWARRHGFEFAPEKQTILAFDKDPTIDPESLFGKRWSKTGITYKKSDLMSELRNTECANANLIILGGVASYYSPDTFREVILKPVFNLLQKGGVFFFDLQLNCPYYQRSMKVFNWPEMKFAEDVSEAIVSMEKMKKILRKDGVRFSIEWSSYTYGEFPTSVMLVLTKE